MKCSKFKHNKNDFFEGPLILQPEVYKDERGYFIENWNMKNFDEILKRPSIFVQDNQSISRKGVLRGMHYQTSPFAQGKLVSCSNGSVFDVIIDLRKNSDTFSFWAGIELKASNFLQLWIPPGFAHGFLSLEMNTIFQYKVTNYYSKNNERSLLWNDSIININWPEIGSEFLISEKDSKAFSFNELVTIDNSFE